MDKIKLYKKCYDRIGMTVIETEDMKAGRIIDFEINDNLDGTHAVHYIVGFDDEQHTRLEKIHESKIVLLKGSEL